MPTPSPKHDTQFQSDDGGTPGDWTNALVTDDSGNGNSLRDGTTKGYLDESAGDDVTPFSVDPEFNVTIRFNHNTGNTNGYIYARQIPSGTLRHGLLVANASTTSLQFVVNNSVLSTTLTMPGSFPASGGDDVVVSWSGRANPLTTGASDAMYNEVRCWNETDGGVAGVTFTSEVPSSLDTADLVFGGRHPALATQDYSGEVIDIHYGTRFHSTPEAYADWVATPTPPTLTADAPIEVPVPDVASGFGAEDELVGPVYTLAAAAAVRNGMITASPLVNVVVLNGQPTFQDAQPDVLRWRSSNVPNDPGGDYDWFGQLSYYPPVGSNCNRIKVHLHVQYNPLAAEDSTIRVYSMNAHPDRLDLAIPGEEPVDTLEYYYDEQTLDGATDDGNGATGGRWVAFDPIKIARAPGGMHTMIAVAIASHTDADWRIRAVHVEPLTVEGDNPGDVDGLHFG